MQSNVAIKGDMVTGTLKFIEGGLSPDGPLAGDGYFLAMKWTDPAQTVTSLKFGLVPSASGMEPVECIDDTDRNGVFKSTPALRQDLVLIQSDGTKTKTQRYTLAGLTLEDTDA